MQNQHISGLSRPCHCLVSPVNSPGSCHLTMPLERLIFHNLGVTTSPERKNLLICFFEKCCKKGDCLVSSPVSDKCPGEFKVLSTVPFCFQLQLSAKVFNCANTGARNQMLPRRCFMPGMGRLGPAAQGGTIAYRQPQLYEP